MDEKKDLKIVSDDGSSLDISPVYDHLNAGMPKSAKEKPTNIIIPKTREDIEKEKEKEKIKDEDNESKDENENENENEDEDKDNNDNENENENNEENSNENNE